MIRPGKTTNFIWIKETESNLTGSRTGFAVGLCASQRLGGAPLPSVFAFFAALHLVCAPGQRD